MYYKLFVNYNVIFCLYTVTFYILVCFVSFNQLILIPKSSDTDALSKPLIQTHKVPVGVWQRCIYLRCKPVRVSIRRPQQMMKHNIVY